MKTLEATNPNQTRTKKPLSSLSTIHSFIELWRYYPKEPEAIFLEKNEFKWRWYTLDENNNTTPRLLKIKKDKPLQPFTYTKPIIKDWWNPKDPKDIVEKPEDALRIWYYPIGITDIPVFRGPNHLHRADQWLFCAVQINGSWETRFFPKSNIPESTRNEAEAYINNENNNI
jgi:hypothetical protein